MGKAAKHLSTKELRRQIGRLDDEEVAEIARGAVDELTARNILPCLVAMDIVEKLAPENLRVRT